MSYSSFVYHKKYFICSYFIHIIPRLQVFSITDIIKYLSLAHENNGSVWTKYYPSQFLKYIKDEFTLKKTYLYKSTCSYALIFFLFLFAVSFWYRCSSWKKCLKVLIFQWHLPIHYKFFSPNGMLIYTWFLSINSYVFSKYKYSLPLNNMCLNHTGPLTCGFFSINILNFFWDLRQLEKHLFFCSLFYCENTGYHTYTI